jgi:hypothetical protein
MGQSIRDKYYTRDEAAVALDVSPRTLDRWWGLRVGPPRTKVGNQVFYRRESVESWLISQEAAPVRAT